MITRSKRGEIKKRWSPESAQNDHGSGQRHQRRAVADRVQGLNGGVVHVLMLGHRGLDPATRTTRPGERGLTGLVVLS